MGRFYIFYFNVFKDTQLSILESLFWYISVIYRFFIVTVLLSAFSCGWVGGWRSFDGFNDHVSETLFFCLLYGSCALNYLTRLATFPILIMHFCLSETPEIMLSDTFLYMGLGPSLCNALYVCMFLSCANWSARGLYHINVNHFSLYLHLKKLN